jgi:hypothetical protein
MMRSRGLAYDDTNRLNKLLRRAGYRVRWAMFAAGEASLVAIRTIIMRHVPPLLPADRFSNDGPALIVRSRAPVA